MNMEFRDDDLFFKREENIQKQITMPEISGIVSGYAAIKEVEELCLSYKRNVK